ncbi:MULTISPECIES: FxLYD domain-containing protein [Pseudoalteromonas]|uniref:FxLYD domain-containing protein n=1 Tax=Pseudoalteromonas TaxID=53246 RepID=UPI00300130CA
MSNNFNEAIKGFFWGIGFVIATLGGISVYALTIAAEVDSGFKEQVSNKALEGTDDLNSDYKLTLSDIFKENGRVRITAELKNITNESIYAVGVIASTFDKNGKFVGNCLGKSDDIFIEPNKSSYIDIHCNLLRPQVSRVHSAKLKFKWLGF